MPLWGVKMKYVEGIKHSAHVTTSTEQPKYGPVLSLP